MLKISEVESQLFSFMVGPFFSYHYFQLKNKIDMYPEQQPKGSNPISSVLVYIVQIEFYISIRHNLELPYIRGSNSISAYNTGYFLLVTI